MFASLSTLKWKRITVVGAERSIQLSYGRTSMKTVRRLRSVEAPRQADSGVDADPGEDCTAAGDGSGDRKRGIFHGT